MGKSSTIDDPYFMYDPATGKSHDKYIREFTAFSLESSGIQIMSIDNLPTEMPFEASEFFSEALYPVVAQMAKNNFDHPVLKRAQITTHQGTLVEKHKHL